MDLVGELTVTQTINKKTRRIKLVTGTETKWVRNKRLANKHKLGQIKRPQGELIAWKSKNSGAMIPRLPTQRNARSHEQGRQNIGRINQNNPLNMGDLKINEMDLRLLSESQASGQFQLDKAENLG
jgi:hypothetical protein